MIMSSLFKLSIHGIGRECIKEQSNRFVRLQSNHRFKFETRKTLFLMAQTASPMQKLTEHFERPSFKWTHINNRVSNAFIPIIRSFASQGDEPVDKEKKSTRADTVHRADQAFTDYLTGDDRVTTSQEKISEQIAFSSQSSGSDTVFSESSSSHQQLNISDPTLNVKGSSSTSNLDDWYNTLHKNQPDLGRPTISDLSEMYRRIESTRQRNLQNSRAKRIDTVHRALMGNVLITAFKFTAYLSSGSSAMLSEFIHSIVDCGNQSLLLIGLRHSSKPTDRYHQYGYGKSIYFWALISALGTFFLGAGVSLTQALPNLIIHGGSIEEITWHVWAVLCFSFIVDGYVFVKTINEIREGGTPTTTSPMKNESESGKLSLWKQIRNVRDPATLAILLEDGAACAGIIFAIMGIALTSLTNMPVFDALAGVAISSLLAVMGIILVQVNHRFLLGQAVDPEIIKGIEKILLSSKSIDHVYSVQSQWTGPETFSYKAEVDFDGTYLAAKLMPRYQQEFVEARATLDQDLRVLLSWYAEDVMRTVEREVKYIEAEIRKQYPGAQYIELEPMSKDADRFAIDDGMEAQIKRIEIENLNRYLRSLYQKDGTQKKKNVKPPAEE